VEVELSGGEEVEDAEGWEVVAEGLSEVLEAVEEVKVEGGVGS
jgi:hypothetical protein